MKKIIILTDYRGAFYSTFKNRNTSLTMDVAAIEKYLTFYGYEVEVLSFSQLQLSSFFKDVYVLYTSSEDIGLTYKSYIEDTILYLENIGAKTLPAYMFLRAHHNKAMMELLRYHFFPASAKKMETQIFGTFEELLITNRNNQTQWPKVIKSAYGAGSGLVDQAFNESELVKLAKRYSRSPNQLYKSIKEAVKSKIQPRYVQRSMHRNKYVVQEMIPRLNGDFKVLCMGKRFYCLYRENRKNDFRASGSGLFTWDIYKYIDESALLNYASQIYISFKTPIASLDIAFDGNEFHLIEFQTLHFGTLTAENSKYYYTKTHEMWDKVEEICNIEAVFADAIDLHIRKLSLV